MGFTIVVFILSLHLINCLFNIIHSANKALPKDENVAQDKERRQQHEHHIERIHRIVLSRGSKLERDATAMIKDAVSIVAPWLWSNYSILCPRYLF